MMPETVTVHSKEWRDIMMHSFSHHGLQENWLQHYGKHFDFERADMRGDFDVMYAMLSESEDVRDYLCWHMKMTCGTFGPYKIETHAAFAPLLHLVVNTS